MERIIPGLLLTTLPNFFHQLIIILGFSIPIIYIFNKIKLPSIIGFLITGIIIGPFGLKLID